MNGLLTSKPFWVILLTAIPFIIIWVSEGLATAVVVYIVIGAMSLFFFYKLKEKQAQRRSQGSSRFLIVEDDDEDSYYAITPARSSSPKVDRKPKKKSVKGFRINPITGKKEPTRSRHRL